MIQFHQFSMTIQPEGDRHRAHCPELDLSTYGTNLEEARINLIEAIELFFELADASEITARLERVHQPLPLAFLLENDPEGGCRAIALEETGEIQNELLDDLCEPRC